MLFHKCKDLTTGSHHALWEVKRTPGKAKTSNLPLTGRLEVEQRDCRWEAWPTHVKKVLDKQKGGEKVKSILDFLLSKLPYPHPLVSLAAKNSRKSIVKEVLFNLRKLEGGLF